MDYPTYQAVVIQALGDLYSKTISYLPNLIAAIIVVIIGWLLAIFLSKLVYKVLEAIKIDHLANQLGLKNLSEKVDQKLSLAALGAWLVKCCFLFWAVSLPRPTFWACSKFPPFVPGCFKLRRTRYCGYGNFAPGHAGG